MKDIELVCATDYEEFFYKDSDEVVNEGDPVGVEWSDTRIRIEKEGEALIHFNLFSNVYWSPKYERE
jgi:hypothetical protein